MRPTLFRVYLNKFKYNRTAKIVSNSTQTDLSKLLTGAEQIVGYNTSYFSLKSLFNDEISNIALNLKSIIEKKHPLFKATKTMLYGDHNFVQLHGLIILLIAKLFCFPVSFKSYTPAEIDQGITSKQRTLSEITQLIYMAKLIQRGITEYSDINTVDKSITSGNNLAVLSGDYLLALACNNLATLEDPLVVEKMSQAIADQMILEYNNYTYQAKPQLNLSQSQCTVHNLLAYSSWCVVKLVNHHEDTYEIAFNFGDNIGQALEILSNMTLQKFEEINPATNSKNYENCLNNLNSSLDILATFPKYDVRNILESIIKSFKSILEHSHHNTFANVLNKL